MGLNSAGPDRRRFVVSNRRMRRGEATGAIAAIVMIVVCSCAETPEAFPEAFETDRGVYSEFVDGAQVRAAIDDLAEHEVELYLAMPSDDVETEELEATLLHARRLGVPVRAWLLLPDEDGYWPGEDNLPAYAELVDRFWRWNDARDLGVEWITVDMEPPLETSNTLAAALEAGGFADIVPILVDNQDAEEHAAASAAWAEAVDDWHARGMKVGVVALPYVLDDFGDDDAELQDMFESPIVGIDWDEVGFLVYQNLYTAPGGGRFGPTLIDSYARTAVEQFGARASVALGAIGSIGKNTSMVGYDEPAALTADVAAAWAAGASKVHLFSLDGMLEVSSPGLWLSASVAEPMAAEESLDVAQARDTISVLDRL